jgi:hypothetical protein
MNEQLEQQGNQEQLEAPYTQHLFDVTREELHDMSKNQGKLMVIGELRAGSLTEHWTGGISLRARLDSGEITHDEITEATERLTEYFVPVKIGAPKRCVDGRTKKGYVDTDPAHHAQGLGPQVQGGTAGDAIGSRLATGYEPNATFAKDIEQQAKSEKSRFAPGDHTDNHATDQKTGCGQIDGQERKLPIYNNERCETLISALSAVFGAVGAPFPAHLAETLKPNAQSIEDNKVKYYGDKTAALDVLRDANPNAIETLMDQHNEVTLTINFVKDTTFDRDSYNAVTDGKLENFNLDAWCIIEEHAEGAFFVLACGSDGYGFD